MQRTTSDVPDRLQFVYCPKCRARLVEDADADGVARCGCPDCGWVHYIANALGVNVLAVTDDGRVAVLYPDEESSLVAFPGGVIEYGETPEEAAVRETREETGLAISVGRELGRYLWVDHAYGSMLSFVFEAAVTGGELASSHEGTGALLEPGDIEISPERLGSTHAWKLYCARVTGAAAPRTTTRVRSGRRGPRP